MKRPFFRTLLTEDDDDQVWCPMRIGFWMAFVITIVMQIAALVMGQPFNPMFFAGGLGALLTGAGAAIYFNGRSDPPKGNP